MTIEEKFELLKDEIEVASKLARDYFDSADFSNEKKADGSVVTEIDQAVEKRIRSFIALHFPEDAVVGEEHADTTGTSGFVWHVDPIDGTDNFLRKIPFCAVSITRLGDTTEGSFAIVHNPITSHTFETFEGGKVYENGHLGKMTAEPLGGKLVPSIGAIGRSPSDRLARYNLQKELALRYGKCVSYSCTALQVAYLAAGRLDAFITFGLNSYDYGAGLYMVKAAGGAISVFEDGEWNLWEKSIKDLCDSHGKIIFASHPDIHIEMRDFIGDPKAWADKA